MALRDGGSGAAAERIALQAIDAEVGGQRSEVGIDQITSAEDLPDLFVGELRAGVGIVQRDASRADLRSLTSDLRQNNGRRADGAAGIPGRGRQVHFPERRS